MCLTEIISNKPEYSASITISRIGRISGTLYVSKNFLCFCNRDIRNDNDEEDENTDFANTNANTNANETEEECVTVVCPFRDITQIEKVDKRSVCVEIGGKKVRICRSIRQAHDIHFIDAYVLSNDITFVCKIQVTHAELVQMRRYIRYNSYVSLACLPVWRGCLDYYRTVEGRMVHFQLPDRCSSVSENNAENGKRR